MCPRLPSQDYQYFGTMLDTQDKLNAATSSQVPELAETAGRFAGQMVLRLVHDHLLPMDLMKYNEMIRSNVVKINAKVKQVQRVGQAQILLLPVLVLFIWSLVLSELD